MNEHSPPKKKRKVISTNDHKHIAHTMDDILTDALLPSIAKEGTVHVDGKYFTSSISSTKDNITNDTPQTLPLSSSEDEDEQEIESFFERVIARGRLNKSKYASIRINFWEGLTLSICF